MPADHRFDVELVFEEVAANIIRHANATDHVELQVKVEPDEVVMRFEDNGVPFDPSQHPDPQFAASLEDAQVGGLGIFLLRQRSTRIAYERSAHNHNVLTIAIVTR